MQKLIKINTDHYIIVDDSEIKEGDWFFANQGLRKCIRVDDKTSCPYITLNEKGEEIGHFHTWRGIVTHSTQPLELLTLSENGLSGMGFSKVKPLNIFNVKELIGEKSWKGYIDGTEWEVEIVDGKFKLK